MPSSRSATPVRRSLTAAVAGLVVGVLAGASARPASAQERPDSALARGMELEQAGRHREAAVAYRSALRSDRSSFALLGLERVLTELGWADSILPPVAAAIRARPTDPLPHTIQLRTLHALNRAVEGRAAFEQWLRDVPRDPTPYREYVRLLLSSGATQPADSILRRAQQQINGGRALASETAQLRASMGLWEPAARSWREALSGEPYLADAAAYSLQPAPAGARAGIRRALLAAPAAPAARRALATLELAWGAPRDAWAALKELPPTDSTASLWLDFADRAEAAEAYAPARDALLALYARRQAPELAARAAAAALSAGDALGALAIVTRVSAGTDSSAAARALLPTRVRILAALGRAEEGERLVAAYGRWLDATDRSRLARVLASGWVRAGNVPKARAALAATGDTASSDAEGWLALYQGDLRGARAGLKLADTATPELVLALSILARTQAPTAPVVGEAFLALAQNDSARAATRFADAARSLPEAAPLLLSTAARLRAAHGDDASAIALWTRIVAEYAQSPEAAEADLEWARALRRRGDVGGAAQRLEHLIVTYPQSALVPQARRELDLARGATPTTS